ncbi:MAG: GNAT family N-acetyltransferase [Alphaproteobacteria bacterium]|nr:GNAT family N-acetyltransferase [Alphaproteobacteria bacterium]
MIAVRHALLEEYEAASSLSWRIFGPVFAATDAREVVHAVTNLREGGELVVAVEDAILVGLAVYLPPEQASGRDQAVISLLGVDACCRRRGAGRHLVDACVTLARSDGSATLAITVPDSLAEAAAFLADLGLQPAGAALSVFGTPARTWQRSVR